MSDKEVGELWAKAKLPIVRDLIRKLVHERALKIYLADGKRSYNQPQLIQEALIMFGIPPETWSEK